MKIKAIILTSVFLSFLTPILCQAYQENLEKYWYYRHRLKEKFMYFNENPSFQGSHIIAENRNEFDLNYPNNNYIRWGDAMWVYGHYIGVLAIEYKLLQINGYSTQETLDELNWAFDTYERLDFNAEPCFNNLFGNPGDPSMNGFFLRDDVPASHSTYFDGLLIQADYSVCQAQSQGNCNSQDQCYLMLLGLRLVNDLVDDGIIQVRTDYIAGLVISSMRWLNPLVMNWVWEIRNPVNLGVPPGGQVIELESYCWAAAEAAGTITGNYEHKGYSSVSKGLFDIAQGTTWQMLQGGMPLIDKFNGYFTMVLSAIINEGGGYGLIIDNNAYNWIVELYELTHAYEGMGAGIGLFPHLALITEILHGYNGSNQQPASLFENDFLNDAPPCGSFNNNITGEDTPPPWHTLSLFSPWHRSLLGGFPGEYNMLDYMMLYNAYFLVYHGDALQYTETSTSTCPELITPDPPDPPYWIYTIAEPKKVEAIRYIDAYDEVNEGGGITYKTGESITFFPGFYAEAGSYVHAEIDPSLLLQPYYMKTNVDPCDGGTFEPLIKNYKSINPVENLISSNDVETSLRSSNNKSIISSIDQSYYTNPLSQDDLNIIINSVNPYPNPTNGTININFPYKLYVISVEVFDYTGRKIHSQNSEKIDFFSFNLSGYSSGIYFVKIKTEKVEKIFKFSKL